MSHVRWQRGPEPDTTSPIRVDNPSFGSGRRPVLAVDAVHNTGHKIDGTLGGFTALARTDGLTVRSFLSRFDSASLAEIDILLIANARSRAEPAVSALSSTELAEVVAWVRSGGSLLLVSDHPPFAEGSADLAEAFGFGPFIGDAVKYPRDFPDRFTKDDGSLADHMITEFGVDTVVTVGGHAFQPPPEAVALLSLVGEWRGRPSGSDEANIDLTGWLQGAALSFDSGRVVFLSEAAVLANLNRFDNAEFALGLLRWLGRAQD